MILFLGQSLLSIYGSYSSYPSNSQIKVCFFVEISKVKSVSCEFKSNPLLPYENVRKKNKSSVGEIALKHADRYQ